MPLSSKVPAPPALPPRHVPRREALTEQEARTRAQNLVRQQRLSHLQSRVVEVLGVAGVLTDHQLGSLVQLSRNSHIRYYQQHLVDRLPTHLLDVAALGVGTFRHLYTLGMVGLELAKLRQRLVPTGYLGLGMHRLTHDLRVNQVVLSLYQATLARGGCPLWWGRYEATVHDHEGRPVLEPDALLGVVEGRRECARWVLEYHNEWDQRRVGKKIELYERVYRDGHWQRVWQTGEMPLVLVVWTHEVVGRSYQERLQRGSLGVRCRYLGKPWTSVMEDDAPEWWMDLRTNQPVNLLAEEER